MASEPLGTTISNEPLTGTSEIQTDTSEPFQLEVLALARAFENKKPVTTNIFLDEQLGFLISSNIYFSEFSMFRS
ncbi:hypothetical protein GLOIN_2v1470034 [Rhizophagus irregularis DAOM 181602=DAOM 197198]|nr:hypothetical protein GLOIN_2v1470034 [Rhizophagus irregularis DAOM 181602=DAOM 197198]